MSAAAQATVELDSTPYFSFTGITLNQVTAIRQLTAEQKHYVQLVLSFKNPGRVRLVYDVERADLVFCEKAVPLGQYDSHSGVLHPDEANTFFIPDALLERPLHGGDTTTLNLSVRYWSQAANRHLLKVTIKVTVLSVDAGTINAKWTFASGPSYA